MIRVSEGMGLDKMKEIKCLITNIFKRDLLSIEVTENKLVLVVKTASHTETKVPSTINCLVIR